jgi:plastocyanin
MKPLMPRRLSLALLVAAAALVFALPGGARPAQNALTGTVGPGFSISLVDESGNLVTHLDPGTYTITVKDLSVEHNFDLTGPGVTQHTDVETTGTVTWTVTFTDGVYTYVCDAHPTQMKGQFAVGTATLPAPKPKPKPKPAAKKLAGSVGPGARIALRTASGVRATSLKAGAYVLTVRDRSKADNFRLRGKGVNVATGVAFTGSKKWKIRLAKGTYRYFSSRHPALKGTVRVR